MDMNLYIYSMEDLAKALKTCLKVIFILIVLLALNSLVMKNDEYVLHIVAFSLVYGGLEFLEYGHKKD